MDKVRQDHLCGLFTLKNGKKVQSEIHLNQGSVGKLPRHDTGST